MNRKVVIIATAAMTLLTAAPAFGQDAKALEKENKAIMKGLKKNLDLKSVEVVVPGDGSWHFRLARRAPFGKSNDLLYGVADKAGKVIISPDYASVTYFPASDEGEGRVPCNDLQTKQYSCDFTLYRPKTAASFLAVGSETVIYSPSGDKICTFESSSVTLLPGYVVVGSSEALNAFSGNVELDGFPTRFVKIVKLRGYGLTLLTTDGKKIVEDFKEMDFSESSPDAVYVRNVDGVDKKGGVMLDGSGVDVPCLFYNVMYINGRWVVRNTSNAPQEDYNPERTYTTGYRDKGEEYFEKRMYDAVISYYANEGIAAPWAKFFTGTALYHKGYDHLWRSKFVSEMIENNGNMRELPDDSGFDFDAAAQLYTTSVAVLEAYLVEDSVYKEQAEIFLKLAKNGPEDIAKAKTRYANALQLLEQRRQQAALAELRHKQEQEQRRTELLSGILSGFIKALAGGGGSTSGSRPAAVVPSAGTTSVGVAPSSSGRGIDKAALADWQVRKKNAEEQVAKYRGMLLKEPNNANLKHILESAQETLNTCNQRIAEIQSGQ